MNPLKQALNLFKNEPKVSLLLGLVAYAFVNLVSRIPYAGAWLMIFGFLTVEIFVWNWQTQQSLHFPKTLYKKILSPLLLTSFILFPTGMLLGSSAGIMQRTDQILASIPLAYFITFISLYFFVVLSHTVFAAVSSEKSFIKLMDEYFAKSLKRPFTTIAACLCLAGIFLLAALPWGLGLIVVLPLLFYVTFFSFQKSP